MVLLVWYIIKFDIIILYTINNNNNHNMSELNSKINNIISQVAKSLPEGTQIEFTQECLDGIEKSLKEPRKSFEEQIKDVCNETIIDKTI